MYDLLDGRRRATRDARARFAARLPRAPPRPRRAAGVAPARSATRSGGAVRVPVAVHTRIFGHAAAAPSSLPIGGDGDGAGVDWRPQLVFPGLRPGERLTRDTACRRARRLLARDGQPLASGAGPPSPSPTRPGSRREIAGQPRPGSSAERAATARGVPADARGRPHRARARFDDAPAGTPGGVAARRRPRVADAHAGAPGATCARRSTRPSQQAAVDRAGRPLRRRRGDRARAPARCSPWPGSPSPRLQPPGSTFKIDHARRRARGATSAKPRPYSRRRPPPRSRASTLENANGESCGGTLRAVVRALVQLGLRPARRQARRQAARRHRRALRLQPAARRSPAPPTSTHPRGRRDRRRPRGRLVGHRPGPGPGHARCRWRVVAATIGQRRRAPALTLLDGATAAPSTRARPAPRVGRARSGAACVAVVRSGTGARGGDPGRHRRRQDRHRRAAHDTVRADPEPATTRAATPRRPDRHRRVVRRLRPRRASRASRSASCSCRPAARAARRGARPRPQRPCSRARLRSSRGRAPRRRGSTVPVVLAAGSVDPRARAGGSGASATVSLKRSSEPWIAPCAAAEFGAAGRARWAGPAAAGRRRRCCGPSGTGA